jgi:putative transcriptional regulator
MPKLSPTEQSFYERVGVRIRELRRLGKGHALSQAQLARKLGVSQNTVSRWESGEHRPTMQDALVIVRFFNVPISRLFFEDEDQSLAGRVSRGIRDLSEKDLSDLLLYIKIRGELNRHDQHQPLGSLGLNAKAIQSR